MPEEFTNELIDPLVKHMIEKHWIKKYFDTMLRKQKYEISIPCNISQQQGLIHHHILIVQRQK